MAETVLLEPQDPSIEAAFNTIALNNESLEDPNQADSNLWAQMAAAVLGSQAQESIAAENPYYQWGNVANQIGNVALQASLKQENPDVGEAALIAGLQGLFGGGLKSYGDTYQDTLTDRYANVFSNVLGGGSGKIEGLPTNLTNEAKRKAQLYKIQSGLQEAYRDEQLGRDKEKSLFSAILKAKSPKDREALLAIGKMEGMIPEGATLPGNEPSVLFGGTPTGDGPVSYGDKVKTRAEELMGSYENLTPNKAFEIAQKEYAPDALVEKNTLAKIEESRERARKMLELAETAEVGMSGAGETGGALNWIREPLSSIYAALGNEEEKNQRASQDILDSVKPDVLRFSRAAGSGALSDFESKALFGSGPSSGKTPEANAALIDKIRKAAAYEKDYSDMQDYYYRKHRTLDGFNNMWESYKRENPLISADGKGVVFNKNRQPWTDFASDYKAKSITSLPAQQDTEVGRGDRAAAIKSIIAKYPATLEGKAQARAEAQSMGLL